MIDEKSPYSFKASLITALLGSATGLAISVALFGVEGIILLATLAMITTGIIVLFGYLSNEARNHAKWVGTRRLFEQLAFLGFRFATKADSSHGAVGWKATLFDEDKPFTNKMITYLLNKRFLPKSTEVAVVVPSDYYFPLLREYPKYDIRKLNRDLFLAERIAAKLQRSRIVNELDSNVRPIAAYVFAELAFGTTPEKIDGERVRFFYRLNFSLGEVYVLRNIPLETMIPCEDLPPKWISHAFSSEEVLAF